MTCMSCGKHVSMAAHKCPHCGSHVPTAAHVLAKAIPAAIIAALLFSLMASA